jgi:dTMP kinase
MTNSLVPKLREEAQLVLRKNDTKGKLIVVEGIDGSGKSTQIDLLYKWLLRAGYSAYFSEWNSSALVKSTTRTAKKSKSFTPTTFSILHCADFADRWENSIYPLLKAGVIVLADRYAFTAFARDVARGVDPEWVRNMYSFAIMPDAALYFSVPLDVAVGRITGARSSLKYYEAGMDLGLSDNINESFKLFQGKILNEYDKMVDEFGLTVIDGTKPVKDQQRKVRSIIKKILVGFEGLPNPNKMPISVTNIQAGKPKKRGSK